MTTPCPKCGATAETVRGICPECGSIRDLAAASAPGPPAPPPSSDKWVHRLERWTSFPYTLVLYVPGIVVLAIGVAVDSPTVIIAGALLLGSPFARFLVGR